MSTNKTEVQNYFVIKEEKIFEIRYYPTATLTSISSDAFSFRDLGFSGFNQLSKLRYGSISRRQHIPVNGSVLMDMGSAGLSVSLEVPLRMENAVSSKENRIQNQISPTEFVAVRQFGGFAFYQRIEYQKTLLINGLQKRGINYHGNFRFLDYNRPYQIFDRRNEVIVAIDSK